MNPDVLDDVSDVDATQLPDAAAPWVQRLMRLTGNEVIAEARATWPELKHAAWKFAFLVYRIHREGLYRPHESLTAWARAELGKDSGTVSKYRSAAEFVLTLEDPTEQEQVMHTPPATLAEAGVPRLAKKDRAEAVKLAAAGMTQRELVQAVRVREAPEQHHDVGPLKTFRVLLSAEAHRDLLAVWYLVRFQCQTPHPADTELAKLLAADYLQSVHIQPETLRWIGGIAASQGWRVVETEAGVTLEQRLEDTDPLEVEALEQLGFQYIVAGHFRCIECGATNPNALEGNHSLPKSHQGHDGPMVVLCMKNHQAVTESWDEHWKQHVTRWMARADLAWFRPVVERWLAGRSLEGV